MTGLRGLLAGLLLLATVTAATAEPKHGLMWVRSDLPRTFPLQVKTAPGRNAYVVLSHADTGAAALAAYIESGQFFRVLVPPGTFRLDVAMGADWRDERALFGPATETYAHPAPLAFGVVGTARKSGHLIDLSKIGPGIEARNEGIALCQRYAFDVESFGRALPSDAAEPDPLRGTSEPDPLEPGPFPRRDWRFDLRERLCG